MKNMHWYSRISHNKTARHMSVILNGEMRVVCNPKGITPFGFTFYAGSSAISLASSATASAL